MLHVQNMKYAAYAADITPFNQTVNGIMGALQKVMMQAGVGQAEAVGAASSAVYGVIAKQAFLDSINDALMMSTVFAIIALPLAFLMKSKKPSADQSQKQANREQEIESTLAIND